MSDQSVQQRPGASEESETTGDADRSPVDLKIAVLGGALATILTFGTMYMLGSIGDAEARYLLEASLPTIRFLASAVATAGATVLALMLTVLGLSTGMERRLRSEHYVRIRQISWLAAVVLLGSVGLLTLMVIPLAEIERVPTSWFEILYYSVLGFVALIGGATFTLVVMLLNAVRGLIDVVDHTVQDPGLTTELD